MTPATLLPAEISLARLRGSLIHAWCEQVEWLDDGPPERELLEKVAGRFLREGLDLNELIEWFGEHLTRPEMHTNLCADSYRTEIAPALFPGLEPQTLEFETLRERRLTFRHENDLVNGTADRLILYRSAGTLVAADVIDFKTDSVNSETDVEQLREVYAHQLNLYRLAIQSIYRLPLDRIAARLALISAGRVVSVG